MSSIFSFLDGFSIAIVFLLWLYAFLNFRKLPRIIPIHFGFDGKPDNYGSKFFIFLLPFIASILYFLLSYNIEVINNYPVKITEKNKEIQFLIGKAAAKSIIGYVIFMFMIFQKNIINFSLNKTKRDLPIIKYILGLFILIGGFVILSNFYK